MNIHKQTKRSAAIAMIAAAIFANMQAIATVVVGGRTQFTDITSASQIDPSNSITKENANWPTWFSSTGSGTYTAVSKSTFNSLANRYILDFESSSGFGTATQKINTSGNIFTATGVITPFSASDAISKITLADDVTINVDGRTFFHSPSSGSPYLGNANSRSVFLVGDREANDTMTSGTQGLTVGNYNGSAQAGIGMYLEFSESLTFFSVTLSNNSATSGGWSPYIVLFDKSGSVVASYGGTCVSGDSVYFGVQIENAEVYSVWVGNKANSSTANYNGVVIDDIGFSFVSQIPEPANVAAILGAVLLLGTLGASVLRKRSMK